MHQHHIKWPDHIDPAKHPIHSYNELLIPASADAIWHKLIDATHWPEWYPNARDVKIVGSEPVLRPGSQFVWNTFGVTVKSRVLVYEPLVDLGWDAAEIMGWRGFHGWKIIPQDSGCLVITEEVQAGVGAGLIKNWILERLQREHQNWLVGLARELK